MRVAILAVLVPSLVLAVPLTLPGSSTANPRKENRYTPPTNPDVLKKMVTAEDINSLVDHVCGSGAASTAINVKCPPYLAKGDGVTDDTASIQEAINAAGGRPVIIPLGNFKVTGTLSVPKKTTILGMDRHESKITYTGSGVLFSLADGIGYFEHTTIRRLHLVGPGKTSTAYAIKTATDAVQNGAAWAMLGELDIDSFGYGISGNIMSGVVEEAFIASCGIGVNLSQWANNVTVRRSGIFYNDRGIVTGGENVNLTELDIEASTGTYGYGIHVATGSARIERGHFEGTTGSTGIYIEGATKVWRSFFGGFTVDAIKIASTASYYARIEECDFAANNGDDIDIADMTGTVNIVECRGLSHALDVVIANAANNITRLDTIYIGTGGLTNGTYYQKGSFKVADTIQGGTVTGDTVNASSAFNLQGYPHAMGTAAPTTGFHSRGEVVWNTNVASAAPEGWRCVSSGTPGTWSAMANHP